MVNKIGLIDIFSRLNFNSKKEITEKIREVYPILVRTSKNRIVCKDENGERLNVIIDVSNDVFKIKDYYVETGLFNVNGNEISGFENDLKRMSESSLFQKLISYNELIEDKKDNHILITKRELIINEIISRRQDN